LPRRPRGRFCFDELHDWRAAAATDGSSTFNHESWCRGGDLMWLVLVIGIFWALSGFWWRR
jgi:hypothetical protein